MESKEWHEALKESRKDGPSVCAFTTLAYSIYT